MLSGGASEEATLDAIEEADYDEDFDEVLRLARPLAEKGNNVAQYYMGLLYDDGYVVDRDPAVALDWFLKSAKQGYAPAQIAAGNSYADGRGVDKNLTEAMRLYRQAADQGKAAAQYNLGYGYEQGLGVATDIEQARTWYQKAAEQGDADAKKALAGLGNRDTYRQLQVAMDAKEWSTALQLAQGLADKSDPMGAYALGRLYLDGSGVKVDPKQAEAWLKKAAAQDHVDAKATLGYLYLGRAGVPQDYGSAFDYTRDAAYDGSPEGQSNLGQAYERGYGVEADVEQARIWYQKAADEGMNDAEDALTSLNSLDEEDKSIASAGRDEIIDYIHIALSLQDFHIAPKLAKPLADKGDAEAEHLLGQMYTYGMGVTKDVKAGVDWLHKAVEQKYARAGADLGYLYMNGIGVDKDYKEAARFFELAATQGEPSAQFNLGVIYEYGYGTQKDLTQARAWYEKAAAQDNDNAKQALALLNHAEPSSPASSAK